MSIRDMEEEETRVFVVLSDTHLGLRPWKRLHFFKNTVAHRPTHVDQFLKWLEKLQSDGEIDLPVAIEERNDDCEYDIKKISGKKLFFPDKLVLNGDIFELWDASDQSVMYASHSILNSIDRLACEKIYLIGNHDFANTELATGEGEKEEVPSNLYPSGLSELNIFRHTYPAPMDGKIRTLRMGEDHYLLIHGHQFFSSFPWEIISFIRDGAEAFRLYSWVLLGLWIIWIGSLPLAAYLQPELSPLIQYGIGIPLAILAFPRLFVSIARPIWNKFFGSRYDRKKAPRGFVKWWKKFTKKNELQGKRINVIYGHTHAIDIVGNSELEKMVNNKIEKIDLTLINHPAWVKDSKSKHKDELQEVFVYVDKYGFEFFGWNWNSNSPFHIPKSVVRTYVSGQKIDNDTADLLNTLLWPKKLIDELKDSGSKTKRVIT